MQKVYCVTDVGDHVRICNLSVYSVSYFDECNDYEYEILSGFYFVF